jgi:poly-gamma-glutamate capsule biosynthesis protein CapA/YwtB (metallophosphatase superfamily)
VKLALAGDAVVPRRLPTDGHRLAGIRELLLDSDAAFANFEVVLDPASGYPQPFFNISGDPGVAADLRQLGIGLASFAHNHALNYGPGGLLGTLALLELADIRTAGAGADLGKARAPTYRDTAGGRVAVVATSTTFLSGEQAADGVPGSVARPGINVVRHRQRIVVDAAAFAVLQRIAQESGLLARRQRQRWVGFLQEPDEGGVELGTATFVPGSGTVETTEPDASDLALQVASIAEARRNADCVILSVHTHEYGPTEDQPPEFVRVLGRAAIDAGADLVVAHGPHLLRGIEVYRGRPIFHSLANLIFQYELVDHVPGDRYVRAGDQSAREFFTRLHHDGLAGFPADPRYWEGVIPVCQLEEGRLVAIELIPIELGFGSDPVVRGLPQIVAGTAGRTILDRLAALSAPLGGTIRVSDTTATLDLGS